MYLRDMSCHARDFECNATGTRLNRVPGAQVLDDCEVLLVPVTGIGKPDNTREYPGNW